MNQKKILLIDDEQDILEILSYNLEKEGYEALFYESLRTIDALRMYQNFGKQGWTHELAVQTKSVLIPEITKAVTLAWYQALVLAEPWKNALY